MGANGAVDARRCKGGVGCFAWRWVDGAWFSLRAARWSGQNEARLSVRPRRKGEPWGRGKGRSIAAGVRACVFVLTTIHVRRAEGGAAEGGGVATGVYMDWRL